MITKEDLTNAILDLKISQEKTDIQIAETSREVKKTSEEVKKTSEEVKKTSEEVKKTSREVAETTRVLADTNKTMKALGINVDGINKSTGLETEEFFFSSLADKLTLGGIKFDSASYNLCVEKQGRSQEIDTFLENGSSVGVVEVKNKVKIEHLKQLQSIVDDFYFFHPSYKNYKIIPALAGKIFPKHIQAEALKQGFVVLTQKGNHVEQLSPVLN